MRHSFDTNVDENGSIHFINDDGEFLTIASDLDMENHTVRLEATGKMISDVDTYMKDELENYVFSNYKVIFSMKGITSISSNCMRVFHAIQMRMDEMKKGSLTLCELPKNILDEFKNIGLDDFIDIE